ncbi:MAG: serine/threonine protein kinase [Planctomycetia bacterium]|nr:serine/threonine protein kinase [Planctomycetia bacterium]
MSASPQSVSAFWDQPTAWKADSSSAIFPRAASGRIGVYDLVEEIARGGMGIVYKALDSGSRRVVALKLMRPDMSDPGATAERFRRELAAVARLNNPHIVPILESGEHEGRPYLVMEFVEGGRLDQTPALFVGNPRLAAALIVKVARAVQHAHDYGIVHRDLKPGNILLDAQGEPKVTDFGLAKLAAGDLDLTRTGETLGTPFYMAPEQVAGRHTDIGPATDVWGLGVVLYELVTGIRPFPMTERHSLYYAIQSAAPIRPRAVRPDMDQALEAILLRCLEKQPARRYTTAASLADDLERWLRAKPVEANSSYRLRVRLRQAGRRGAWLAALSGLMLAGLTATYVIRPAPIYSGARSSPTVPEAKPPSSPAVPEVPARPSPLDQLLAELAQNNEVTLVAGSKPPRWWRSRAGNDSNLQLRTFGLQSYPRSLLDLLPYLPARARTRISCELTADRPFPAEGGLYFACQECASARGIEQLYCSVTLQQIDGRRQLTCQVCRLAPYAPGSGEHAHHRVLLDHRERKPIPPGERWVALDVDIGPHAVRVQLDGQPVGEVSTPDLVRATREYATVEPPLTTAPITYQPQGAVGICVYRTETKFRNLRVSQSD